jgi:subtilisin family serine protease
MTIPLASVGADASKNQVLEERGTFDADMINSDDTGYTGEGVYVAVLDTGIVPNWKDYFPTENVMIDLAKGFKEELMWDPVNESFIESGTVHEISYIGSLGSAHGTHVTSTIIGFNYYAPADDAVGLTLPPVYVEGIAPDAKIIPVRVLVDYTIGASQVDPVNYTEQKFVMGTDRAVAAGIRYATDLKLAGYSPMIVTMSLGGPLPSQVMEDALDYAVDNGVIVVASAGNEGDLGMGYPGGYSQVISVGACGWRYEWYWPDFTSPDVDDLGRYRLWWLKDDTYGFNDVTEDSAALANDIYMAEWSSRELEGQQLDVVAPGTWIRGPYPGAQSYAHLPWWSLGSGEMSGMNPGNFYWLGGTSMAAPHVTAVAAQMLQKDPTLAQAEVEEILKTTALGIPAGSMTVFDLSPAMGWYTYSWETDATGSGLIQADLALSAVDAP